MRIEWEHFEENDHDLETWTTTIYGVTLYVMNVTTEVAPMYLWRTNLSGSNGVARTHPTLIEAMIASIQFVKELHS